MMNKTWMVAVALFGAALCMALDEFDPKSPRKISIGETPVLALAVGGKPTFEIVAGKTPSAEFAANELATILEQALGNRPPVVTQPTGGKPAILVGTRQAEGLDRDGYIIRTEGSNLFIYGKDDPSRRLLKDTYFYRESPDRGTLFGVYDFLERFANVRFYFPGEIGTIIPPLADWSIPAIDIMDRPDFTYGHVKMGNGMTLDEARRAVFRLRLGSNTIPNCHGLAFLGFIPRFKESHPEYFALMDNGLRHYDTHAARPSSRNGHICISSGIRDVIVEDAIAFLSGKPASERGVCLSNGKSGWSHSRYPAGMPYFNVMLNDSYYRCRCEKCWPRYSKGAQETSNFTWEFFNEIARKVKASGVPGRLTTMAYDGYRMVPEMPIEDNILVMLALRGPWNERNEVARKWGLELLQAWNRKINRKLWLWTYPSKFRLDMPGIPNVAPHSTYSFYKSCQPWIFGAYLEAETDCAEFNFLNFYVFGRLAWDNSLELDTILTDYYHTMFGPAASAMRRFDEALEDNWMRVVTPFEDTDIGPVPHPPTTAVLWNEIYTPEYLSRLEALLNEAAAAVRNHAVEAKRVDYFRQHFYQPIVEGRNAWLAQNLARDHWTAIPPCKLFLIPNGGKTEVTTTVTVSEEEANWRFTFDCEEPFIEKVPLIKRAHDDTNVWADGCVTIFLDPGCTRKDYFQIEVSPAGVLTDLQKKDERSNYGWESGAEVVCEIIPGKGWRADIRVPKKALGEISPKGMAANFMRYRVLPETTIQTTVYQWNPSGKSPHSPVEWGRLLPGVTEPPSLIENGDFEGVPKGRFLILNKKWQWAYTGDFLLDETTFVTAGRSVILKPAGHVAQYLTDLKPKTQYRLSFYARLEGVEGNGFYVKLDEGSGYVTTWPAVPMKGTFPWRRFETVMKTADGIGRNSKPYLRFQFPEKNSGTVWVDHVRLEAIPADGE